MSIVNFVIAIVALIIAVLAYYRSGGVKDLRKNTATLLSKMEETVRAGETTGDDKQKTK